jgi:hypothetical protein
MMTAFVLSMYPFMATAGDTISDPKSWADNFVRLVAARDTDGMTNALIESAKEEKKPEDFKVELAQIVQLLPRVGEISATDMIAQREWGKSLVMYWYYLDFKNKVLIVSLRLGKHGDSWQLSQANFNTDIDDAKLP